MLQSVPVLIHKVSRRASAMLARGSPAAVQSGSANFRGVRSGAEGVGSMLTPWLPAAAPRSGRPRKAEEQRLSRETKTTVLNFALSGTSIKSTARPRLQTRGPVALADSGLLLYLRMPRTIAESSLADRKVRPGTFEVSEPFGSSRRDDSKGAYFGTHTDGGRRAGALEGRTFRARDKVCERG